MAEIRGSFGGNDGTGKWCFDWSRVMLLCLKHSGFVLSLSKAHCQLHLWDPNHWAQSDCLRRSGEFHLGALQEE